jgi:flagellar hook-length control protein FliK
VSRSGRLDDHFTAKGGDILNPISILLPTPSTNSGTNLSGTTEATPSAGSSNGAIFKATLGSSLQALFAGKITSSSSTAAPTASVDGALELKIREQLDRGTPLTDVVTSLANSLASSVASLLGIPLDAAKQRLTQAFSAALAPTGTGPPQTNAERASSLVQRFRQIAELATRVTTEDSGQTIRSISGTSSDAEQAGAHPAPTPDRMISDATLALAAAASSATTLTNASTASTASVAQATGSDGRVVALEPAQAIATGGDTPLGRILARAALLDAGSTGPIASPIVPQSEEAATAAASAVLAASASRTPQPSLRAPAPTDKTTTTTISPSASATSAASGTSGKSGTSANTLDAFVQAFTAAVRREDGPRSTATPDSGIPSISIDPKLYTGPVATPLQGGVPFAITNAIDAGAIAPPTPASTLPPREHVDANAVVDQVLRGVNVRTTDGSSEVRLRLVPESLGDVNVKLVVTGGSVDASITTHNADAQNVLAGAQNQLAKSLADAGLKLQSFTVSLAGGFAGNRDQQSPPSWTNRSNTRRIGGVESVGADNGEDPALLAVPSFGPPIFTANSAYAGFNYLV